MGVQTGVGNGGVETLKEVGSLRQGAGLCKRVIHDACCIRSGQVVGLK
jgi:hypothetical protein